MRYIVNSCLCYILLGQGLFIYQTTSLPQRNAHGLQHGALAAV